MLCTYSIWPICATKNTVWSSITDQFPVSHWSVTPIHSTGDCITWPQSGQSILRFLLFSLSILHIFIIRNRFKHQFILLFYISLFETDLTSFYITKLRSDRSPVHQRSISQQSSTRQIVALIGSRTVHCMGKAKN